MLKLKQAIAILFITLVLAEIALRLLGSLKVYSESVGNGYATDFDMVPNSWYLTWSPGSEFVPANSDYQYPYSINHFGLREREFSAKREDSVIRILVTGDSFVEGAGAPYDSTWPHALQTVLRARGIPAEVIAGGRSGSDIFYDYVRYRDQLHTLHPDIVIAAQNSSDFVDTYFRCGMGRFQPDGTVKYNAKPPREFFYHYLHLYRLWLIIRQYPFRGVFLDYGEWETFTAQATSQFCHTAIAYQDTVAEAGARFVYLSHAIPSEILYDFPANHLALKNLKHVSDTLNSLGYTAIHIATPLQQHFKPQPRQSFTYPHDLHYNSNGYYYLAQQVADSLIARGIFTTNRSLNFPN